MLIKLSKLDVRNLIELFTQIEKDFPFYTLTAKYYREKIQKALNYSKGNQDKAKYLMDGD